MAKGAKKPKSQEKAGSSSKSNGDLCLINRTTRSRSKSKATVSMIPEIEQKKQNYGKKQCN